MRSTTNFLKLILFCSLFLVQCISVGPGVSSAGIDNYFERSLYGTGLPLRYAETGPWELGLTFVAHKDGIIKAINIKNPDLGTKRVSIWDTNTRTLITSFEFRTESDKEFQKNLINFKIEKGKTYTISFNAKNYYYHEPIFKKLPISDDNLTLLSTNFTPGTWQQFPDKQIDNIIHGLIDIDFQWVIN